MTESYTPQEFTDLINSKNTGPTYDPLGTEALRRRLLDTQAREGDILAQAKQTVNQTELQKQEEYLSSPEGKIAKAEQEIQDMKTWLLSDGTYNSEEVDNIINRLTVEYDEDTNEAVVRGPLELNGLTSAEGLKLPENVGGYLMLGRLTSAEGLTLPDNVGGGLYLDGLTSAEGLKLPDNVGGDLWLGGLTSAEGLQLPENVGGGLGLRGLTSAEGLQLPESVGGDLWLSGLTSAEGLTLTDNVGGSLYLFGLDESDKQKLRELRPDLASKI
jgi:hypothetical protein